LGHKFIDNGDTTLIGQLGAGYKRSKKNPTDDTSPPSTASAVGTAGLEFKQQLTGNTVLLDKLAVEAGVNVQARNDLSLQVKMSDKMALALGYQLRYYSEPGNRIVNNVSYANASTDRLLTVNLVYEFK